MSSITGAVSGLGLSGGKKEEPVVESKPQDERVDKVPDQNVEEFVRKQHPSTTAKGVDA